ncbi:MAG TPA: hypothetical protein DDZ60_00435 [Planktothrix sp. UBA10369]|nr:hypothetical protein [Microcoleaceae cyanobacterium UBA11344]HBK21016.1 hypothetical protein [Planktothrix sp. UBA10369]
MVKICHKLTDVVHIAGITSEPIQPPLRGILPNQPNLKTAFQSGKRYNSFENRLTQFRAII